MVKAAQQYVAEDRRVVVDMDLEKFFDRVNHDLLMQKLSVKIDDGRMLRLIRWYLEAGMMADGIVTPRTEGTPQGGPLSPLLSNILLTELDRELAGIQRQVQNLMLSAERSGGRYLSIPGRRPTIKRAVSGAKSFVPSCTESRR